MSSDAPTVADIKEFQVDELLTDYEVVCVCGNAHIVTSRASPDMIALGNAAALAMYRERARMEAHRKLMTAVRACERARNIQAEDEAVAADPAVSAVRDAVVALYQMPECEVGGPLHVQVEDLNLEDHFLTEPCWTGWRDDRSFFAPEVWEHGERVRVALLALSQEQRIAVCCSAHRIIAAR